MWVFPRAGSPTVTTRIFPACQRRPDSVANRYTLDLALKQHGELLTHCTEVRPSRVATTQCRRVLVIVLLISEWYEGKMRLCTGRRLNTEDNGACGGDYGRDRFPGPFAAEAPTGKNRHKFWTEIEGFSLLISRSTVSISRIIILRIGNSTPFDSYTKFPINSSPTTCMWL